MRIWTSSIKSKTCHFLTFVRFSNALILPPQYICLNKFWEYNVTEPFTEYVGDDVEDVEKLYYDHCQYVHFSSGLPKGNKPWQMNLDDVKKARPDAHPIFAKMFEDFYTGKEELCPFIL
jgi:hypothetical protein